MFKGLNRNVAFQTHRFCMTIDGLAWNSSVKHKCKITLIYSKVSPGTRPPEKLVMINTSVFSQMFNTTVPFLNDLLRIRKCSQ